MTNVRKATWAEQNKFRTSAEYFSSLFFILVYPHSSLCVTHTNANDPQNKKLPSPYMALTDLFVCRSRLRSP